MDDVGVEMGAFALDDDVYALLECEEDFKQIVKLPVITLKTCVRSWLILSGWKKR